MGEKSPKLRKYHPKLEKITQNEEKSCLKWEKVAQM
jgi:hypothetical protein